MQPPISAPLGVRAAVRLPELAVPPDVLVLSVCAPGDPSRLVDGWVDRVPQLAAHRAELEVIVRAAAGPPSAGDVAVFLSYQEIAGQLVGGAAVLALESLDPAEVAGPEELAEGLDKPESGGLGEGDPVATRADWLAESLRRAAHRLGLLEACTDIGTRRTRGGLPAVRLQILALVGGGLDGLDGLDGSAGETPMAEACRWLYPLPDRPDLAWSLVFQTTDIGAADGLIADFDRLAGSLTWCDAAES